MDKLIRFAVLPRGGEPVLWDFGSAAKHHQLFNPWLDGTERARAGISTLRGAFHPDAGHRRGGRPQGRDRAPRARPRERAARRRPGRDADPRRAPGRGHRRRRRPAGVPRGAADQDPGRDQPAHPGLLDGRRGVRRALLASCAPACGRTSASALVSKVLYDLGSEYVEGVNAISGERCSPHPHVYSDRVVRPGDPAFFDILHSHLGYRTCYYRCFAVGSASPAMRDAYTRCREYMDAAIAIVKPGTTTADVVELWPTAQEFGFPDEEAAFALQYGHGVGPVDLGEADLQPAGLARPPGGARGGHGLRAGDLLARRRRLVGRADRGGGRGHRRRVRGDHQVPGRGPPGRRPALLDRRRVAAHGARLAVAPEHREGPGRA